MTTAIINNVMPGDEAAPGRIDLKNRDVQAVLSGLPRYYDAAGPFLERLSNGRSYYDLQAVEMEARAIAVGLTRSMLDRGWVTPQGSVVNEEARAVRRLQRSLKRVSALAAAALVA